MDARSLHDDAVVVDAHNDLILVVDHFDSRGQTNHFGEFWLPQLRAGGVDVQVMPVCMHRPFQSEGALRRTMLLVERIYRLADQHSDEVVICLTADEVDAAVAAGRIALIIAIEGAHSIGQDAVLIRALFRVGVRVVSLTHNGRTLLADGSGLDSSSRSRLTPEGIEVFTEMERLGMIFDVSHLGIAGVDDVLERATRPLLATHSACLALIDVHRNLGNPQIKGIAELGGVVHLAAAVPQFIDPKNPSSERVIDHVEHLIDAVGVDHIGIGPDFMEDYMQSVYGQWLFPPGIEPHERPADVERPADLPKLTEVMVRRGFAEADIRKILGGNALRVLREVMGVPKR